MMHFRSDISNVTPTCLRCSPRASWTTLPCSSCGARRRPAGSTRNRVCRRWPRACPSLSVAEPCAIAERPLPLAPVPVRWLGGSMRVGVCENPSASLRALNVRRFVAEQ